MIQYVQGDATQPQGSGPRIIMHCVNDEGKWGAGFVVALSKQWPFAEEAYRFWHQNGLEKTNEKWPKKVDTSGPLQLGEVQLCLVAPKLWIANLVGQHGVGMTADRRPPIRYDAIQNGLKKVYRLSQIHGTTVHMPKMGSDDSVNWVAVENLVKVELSSRGVPVFVYASQ